MSRTEKKVGSELESVIVEHLVSENVHPEDLYAYVHSCLGKKNRINDYFMSQLDAVDLDHVTDEVKKLTQD